MFIITLLCISILIYLFIGYCFYEDNFDEENKLWAYLSLILWPIQIIMILIVFIIYSIFWAMYGEK
jgi:uncharacterized membrane protein